jgi:hypothetical protein
MPNDSTSQQFQAVKEQYFDPLCQRLYLDQAPAKVGSGYAVAAASRGNVRVYFEYERGLSHFSVGPAVDAKAMCDVETLAARFPRVRALPDGAQRLTLDEQSAMLLEHWASLQDMYSPEHLPAARAWIAEVRAEVTRKYSGGS